MHDAMFMRRREPTSNIRRDRQSFGLGEASLLLEPIAEVNACHEFEHEKMGPLFLVDLKQVRDIRIVDLCQQPGLLVEAAEGLGLSSQVGTHDLNRDHGAVDRVFAPVDRAHAALAELLQQAVASEPASLE